MIHKKAPLSVPTEPGTRGLRSHPKETVKEEQENEREGHFEDTRVANWGSRFKSTGNWQAGTQIRILGKFFKDCFGPAEEPFQYTNRKLFSSCWDSDQPVQPFITLWGVKSTLR